MTKEELEKLLTRIIKEEVEDEVRGSMGVLHRQILESQDKLQQEIKASEKRLTKKIDQGNMQILDILTRTADEILKQQEPRISQIEEHLGLENPTKKN